MENKENEFKDRDDQEFTNENQENDTITRDEISGINKTVRGDDIPEIKKEERITHQQHGNRKYKMFKNESAVDNSPRTSTGPGTI